MCRGINKEFETLITQRNILSLVSLVFDPIGSFGPFIIQTRRFLTDSWTKNGQRWEVEAGKESEFSKVKKQHPIVSEASISIESSSIQPGQNSITCVCLLEDQMCEVVYIWSQREEISANSAPINAKYRVHPMRHFSTPRLQFLAVFIAVTLKKQIVNERENKIHSCSVWLDSATVLYWIHSSYRKNGFWLIE